MRRPRRRAGGSDLDIDIARRAQRSASGFASARALTTSVGTAPTRRRRGSVPRASLGESVTRHRGRGDWPAVEPPFDRRSRPHLAHRREPRPLLSPRYLVSFAAWECWATVHGSGKGLLVEHEDDALYAAGVRASASRFRCGSRSSFGPQLDALANFTRVELQVTIPWFWKAPPFQRSSVASVLADFSVTDSSRFVPTRNYEPGQDRFGRYRPRRGTPRFRRGLSLRVRLRVVFAGRLGVRPSDLEDVTHDVLHPRLPAARPLRSRRPLRPWLFGFAYWVASITGASARHRVEARGDLGDLADSGPPPRPGRGHAQSLALAWKGDRRARSRPPAQCFSSTKSKATRCPRCPAPCASRSTPLTRACGSRAPNSPRQCSATVRGFLMTTEIRPFSDPEASRRSFGSTSRGWQPARRHTACAAPAANHRRISRRRDVGPFAQRVVATGKPARRRQRGRVRSRSVLAALFLAEAWARGDPSALGPARRPRGAR